ncbi:uncharacterized protein LOC117173028 [Belonocnema kinseyi]|uniref:uncharacterized protein LOC117173028 n=1 Tax=Belonocnema kinseyi TaxID=2817044 RepID=UPI00143CE5AF|nr:uncharacterized protein LOC117173028 [Belonocnema kinseyi]
MKNSTINQNHQMELVTQNPKNCCERNNGQSSSNEEILSVPVGKVDSRKTTFKEVFTLPVEYLHKKKRIAVEKTGISKLPSVGSSDAWYGIHLEKENIKRRKRKNNKIKKMQEDKKKLMEQVRAIHKRIKEEKQH